MPRRFACSPQPAACAALLSAMLAASPAPAAGPQVRTVRDVSTALLGCWKPPAEAAGSELTLRFSLTPDGHVRGRPMITYSRLLGPADLQRAFVASVFGVFRDCLPLDLSPQMKPAVFRTIFSLRFILATRPPQTF